MEEIPYTIVPFSIEKKNWEKIFDHVSWNKHVPDDLKHLWMEALQFMHKEFGKNFFNKSRNDHPVDHLLGMGSEVEIRYLLRWVEAYKKLKTTAKYFPSLRGKLISNSRCRSEGMPFMDIAVRYGNNGFHVDFPPEVADHKNPDILLTHEQSGDQLYIEVSRIGSTDQHDKEFKQYVDLQHAIDRIGYYLPCWGHIKQYMNETAYQEVIETVTKIKQECWDKQTVTWFENENIIIGFSTDGSFDSLQAWAAENNVSEGFNGLRVDVNETDRIIRQKRVAQEAGQIPPQASGLIYFPVPAIFLLFTNPAEIIDKIGSELFPHPNILGIVLYADTFTSIKKDDVLEDDLVIYSISSQPGPYTRESIYIQNPYYTGILTKECILAIRHVLR